MIYPSSPVHESNYGIPRVDTTHILLHGTGLSLDATAEDELKSFSNPSQKGMGKSYSYYIAKDGRVWSLAPPDRIAFHAGASSWNKDAAARRKVVWPTEEGDAQFAALNLISIGIGMESHNTEGEVYPEAQLHACATLCRDLMQRYNIPTHRILTHYMVSAPRKVDPVNFNLEQFYERLEKLRPPLLVVDAPEPVVHEGDYGSDIVLRIRGKELKVDARFDSGQPVPATVLSAISKRVDEVLIPPPTVKVMSLQGDEPVMPIPARDAIVLKSKAARAADPEFEYKVDDKEPVTKYVTVIGNIIGALLSIAVATGLLTLTDLEAENMVLAVTGAMTAIWPVVISISASIARSKTYSEATVGQQLADFQEVVKSEPVR